MSISPTINFFYYLLSVTLATLWSYCFDRVLRPLCRNLGNIRSQVTISAVPICGEIISLCSTDSSKNAITYEPIMQFGCPLRFRIFKNIQAPSLTMWAWRRHKNIFTKDQSVKVKDKVRGHFLLTFWWFPEGFVIQCLNVPDGCAWGALWGLHGSSGGILRAPEVLLILPRPFQFIFLRTSWRHSCSISL